MVPAGPASEGSDAATTGPATEVVGLGTDLVDIDRFRRVLARTPRLADRVFTDAERRAVAARRDPVPGLAARFAAKEAVLKALDRGVFAVPLRHIEVVTQESGAPAVVLHGVAGEVAAQRGVSGFLVSLTHTDHLAQATVAALS